MKPVIRGIVNPRHEAVVPLLVRGPQGSTLSVEAIVDTGFTDFLALPVSAVTSLGLVPRSTYRMRLADGAVHMVEYYEAELLWNGV